MIKVKLFDLDFGEVVIRFFVAMAFALVLGFMQQWILMPFVAGPIAASALLGARFGLGSPAAAMQTKKVFQLDTGKQKQFKKAS
ncbi:MAG: hypothetical protein AAF960_03080 [Bacteroidota bacterium]